MFNNKEDYREALIAMQRIQDAGGWIRFGDIKERYNLHTLSRKKMIPDLAGLDLNNDEEVDRLYEMQEEFLRKFAKLNAERGKGAYHRMREKLGEAQAENAALREENRRLLAKLKKA